MSPGTTGYSGTPLAKKLGLRDGCRLLLLDAPGDYRNLFDAWPKDVVRVPESGRPVEADLVHLFVTEQDVLAAHLQRLRTALDVSTPIWVSWPKKSSKVPSTVTEDSIRSAALPLGFVDIKVCAVSAVWSGLKLVVRKSER